MEAQKATRWAYIPGSNTGSVAGVDQRQLPPVVRANGQVQMVSYAKPNMDYAPEQNINEEELGKMHSSHFIPCCERQLVCYRREVR